MLSARRRVVVMANFMRMLSENVIVILFKSDAVIGWPFGPPRFLGLGPTLRATTLRTPLSWTLDPSSPQLPTGPLSLSPSLWDPSSLSPGSRRRQGRIWDPSDSQGARKKAYARPPGLFLGPPWSPRGPERNPRGPRKSLLGVLKKAPVPLWISGSLALQFINSQLSGSIGFFATDLRNFSFSRQFLA